MKKRILFLFSIVFVCAIVCAQEVLQSKFSPFVRRAMLENREQQRQPSPQSTRSPQRPGELMALVRCSRPQALVEAGCRLVRSWDDIYATSIPLNCLEAVGRLPEVTRIEAGSPCHVSLDTTAVILGVNELWSGVEGLTGPSMEEMEGLNGRGVVMGIQDIGFDLTHPTFYSRDLQEYRIKAFWDMLDTDTLESELYVGRDYTTEADLLQKARATDGLKQTHGVHTAGIAAGSGYDSPYVGMAPEADLCLVANAVGSDKEFIDEENMYRYTTATDMLGFQYIFDYARSQGKPCVISFSEGAHEDLYGDAQLLYEVLEKMTGPGRIVVASAGNSSVNKTYLRKPQGVQETSSFIYSNTEGAYYTLRHTAKTDIQLHFSLTSAPEHQVLTKTVSTDQILSCPDSLLVDTFLVEDQQYVLMMASYPSCYNPEDWATELYIKTLTQKVFGIGGTQRARLALTGADAEVECYGSGGIFLDISTLPQFQTAEATHNINFPAAAPSVIAVGGTAYRTGVRNYDGRWKDYNMGDDGRRWAYSSVGPTMMGLTKPDVMAPACNIISAYSSFYLESNPTASDVDWDASRFSFRGRTYGWNCNSGTSMSSPIAGGIVALWLQLCPALTPAMVMETISQTARRYDPELTYPNNEYGWGEIDALAGARYIQKHFDWHVGLPLAPQSPSAAPTFFDLSGRRLSEPPSRGLYLQVSAEGVKKMVGRKN